MNYLIHSSLNQEQVIEPLASIAILTPVAVVGTEKARHLTPEAPELNVLDEIVPPVEIPVVGIEHVTPGPLAIVAGCAPTPPETRNVAHSFASPIASPTAEPAAAAFLAWRKFGRATAERIPTIATTIINSISVKPF